MKAFILKLGTRLVSPLSPLLFNIALGVLVTAIRGKKKKKKESILEKKSQNSQFADYMILYLENPNDTSRKLLGLINEYNTLSLVFLYNNNKRTEREIKETILLTIAMRRKNT